MTIREIEIKYQINHGTIKRHMNKGEIEGIKTSKGWNIDEKQFVKWYNEYKNGYHSLQPWNRKIFSKIDSPEKAYWLGFINADGCILDKAQYVSIDISGKDKEHLEKFVSFINGKNDLIKTTYHSITGNELIHIKLCSEELMRDLIKLGIKPRKSGKEKYIETDYDRDFIRGLIDGDGCILNNLKGIDLVGSEELLKTVQNKFLKYLNVQPRKIMKHGIIYKISYRSKEDVYKIVKFLYGDNLVSLARKQKLANQIIENYEKIC